MNDIIIKINKLDRTVLPEKTIIGNDGENLQCRLVFEFEDNFVDGIGRVEYSAGEDKNYIWISKEDNKYYLPIKDVVTKEGNVNFQLVITEEQTTDGIPLFKSNVFTLYCKESINAVEEAPEGYELWIDQANQKIMEMDNLNIEVEKIDNVCYITLTDKEGNTKVVTVNDGNGIVSIEKTSSVGLVDTYTIIFTDGTTTTFQVTNGADGEITMQQFEQAMMVYNALPKVTGSGSEISLNDTAECPMEIKLNGNGGRQLFNKTNCIGRYNTSETVLNTGVRVTQTSDGTSGYSGYKIGGSELLGKTITLRATVTASGTNNPYIRVFYGRSNKIYDQSINGWNMSQLSTAKTITLPSSFNEGNDSVYVLLYSTFGGSSQSAGIYVDFTDLQVELGDTASPYENYGISVTGNNTIKISNSDDTEYQEYPINLGTTKLYYGDTIKKSSNDWIILRKDGTSTTITDTTLIEQLNSTEYGFSYKEQTNITQTNAESPFIINSVAIHTLENIFDGGA